MAHPRGRFAPTVPAPPQRVRLTFAGANPTPTIAPLDRTTTTITVASGTDAADWQRDLPTYVGIVYQALYPGIDLHYEGHAGQLKSTYRVAAGVNPDQIRLRYDGVDQIAIDPTTGDLQLTLPPATTGILTPTTIIEHAPVAWQEQNGTQLPVTVQYVRNADGSVGFALGSYDPTALLTIDPVVSISSFVTESSITSTDIVIDNSAGIAYIAGYVYDGSRDAMIMARTLTTPTVEEYLYLHGAGNDEGHGIAVDSSGAVYLVGETNSSGFLDSTEYHGGNCSPYIQYDCPDIFVARLTYGPNGFTITGRTLLGSSQDERGNGIAVDAAGDIYVTGSIDLTHAYGARLHWDAVNQVLNPVYTVALDGDGQASGNGIAVDADHNAYITGITALYIGGEFPADAYIAKLNPAGTVIWEQSFGGDEADYANRVALDEQGRVYLTGATSSFTNFPTLNPLPVSYGGTSGEGGDYIAFAAMYTSAGVPVYRTLVAGDGGNGIAVDQDGRAYIATDRFVENNDDSSQLYGVALTIKPNGTGWGYDELLSISGAAGIALDRYATAYVAVDSAVGIVTDDPPTTTTSYYMSSVKTADAYDLGCTARTNGERGLVILDFGSPRDQDTNGNPMRGTRLLRNARLFMSLTEIAAAVEYFGKGYMTCRMALGDAEVDHTLIISIGTSNSKICPNDDLEHCKGLTLVDNTALNASSGRDWANMVIKVNNAFHAASYYPYLKAAGGYDAEFGVGFHSTGTIEWAQGYSQVMESNVGVEANARLVAAYYNFGSCDGCPTPADMWPGNTARMREVYMVSKGVGWAYPLPQIYLVTMGYQ